MINTAEVILWGTRIGIIHLDESKPYLAFEYDRDFLESGIELAPFHMPLSNRIYEFPSLVGEAFHGAPGLIADSLPDKFGNKVIERWLAEQGKSIGEFNVVDRLCYTGTRGMGALEYKPSFGLEKQALEDINVSKMVEFASEILADKKNERLSAEENIGYSQLVQLGTSAGGARAKALIVWNEESKEIKSGQINAGNGFEYWLMKFDGVSKNGDHNLEDSIEYTLIEYAYYLMAKASKIEMNECRIFEDAGRHHFMTKRFDRANNKKLHMQTLGALAHIDYNVPGLCSYEQAAYYMKELGLSGKEIEQFYRRMVFNVIFVNQDDHVKNVSFLMDRNGKWKLSPAYDITFSYDEKNEWLKAHQMLINGKSSGIQYEDLIASGKTMGLSKQKCNRIISEVEEVSTHFSEYFDKANVKEQTCHILKQVIQDNRIR
jgi:serine/threonine-protein kinase HipA